MKFHVLKSLGFLLPLVVFILALISCTDDDPPRETTLPPSETGRIYLDDNGVTVKCNDAAQIGFQGIEKPSRK